MGAWKYTVIKGERRGTISKEAEVRELDTAYGGRPDLTVKRKKKQRGNLLERRVICVGGVVPKQ